jgi:hypothetical protein
MGHSAQWVVSVGCEDGHSHPLLLGRARFVQGVEHLCPNFVLPAPRGEEPFSQPLPRAAHLRPNCVSATNADKKKGPMRRAEGPSSASAGYPVRS